MKWKPQKRIDLMTLRSICSEIHFPELSAALTAAMEGLTLFYGSSAAPVTLTKNMTIIHSRGTAG